MLFGVRQSVMSDEGRDVREFCRLSSEKFAAGRRVEEEIGNRDGGAAWKRSVVDVVDFAACNLQMCAGGLVACCRIQRDAGTRCNGWQRFAAKAECRNGVKFVGGALLGGCMPLE